MSYPCPYEGVCFPEVPGYEAGYARCPVCGGFHSHIEIKENITRLQWLHRTEECFFTGQVPAARSQDTQPVKRDRYDILLGKKGSDQPVQEGKCLSLNEVEQARYDDFQKKHYEEHKFKGGVPVTITPTGVGNHVGVQCPVCFKRMDISDYDGW